MTQQKNVMDLSL